MLTYTLSTTEDELRQILELQQCNLPSFITEDERKKEGFVTVQHDFNLLKEMHFKCPHTLAKDGDTIVGYALSMHPDFGEHIEILRPMFAQIKEAKNQYFDSATYMVMGQICIAKEYRKQGIFRNLYETMKTTLLSDYSAIVTEVDSNNERSLNAHYAVGFEDLGRYTSEGKEWVLLYLS
jgi:ribosomal protein S18 acetylase RimI-like enzyme